MPTLEFKGKQFVYSHHLGVPFRELQVEPKKSLPLKGQKASLDDNLIIHGDNLEALKALLPTHAGKVDCIFIDPPYNTGNEGWCYNDNVRSPLMKEWLKKSANPVDKEDLERHDKWLCMMWPRLNLLKDLLAEDGSIWITLDDNEAQRAKLILDEIFGEDAFVASIAWQARYSVSNDASVSTSHNYILVYSKAPETWKKLRNEIPRDEKQEKQYSNPDNDPDGPWRAILDESQCVHWWHRIAVNQRSYGLQGWQRHRVYPDLLACVHGAEDGKFRFTVLETKGDHLKGNDDTEYKRKLFELLTNYADVTAAVGQLELEDKDEPIRFQMLMEADWKSSVSEALK